MPRDYNFWVFIVTNRNHSALCIGVTNRLSRRTWEHRKGTGITTFVMRMGSFVPAGTVSIADLSAQHRNVGLSSTDRFLMGK
jgi:hypothetical protein